MKPVKSGAPSPKPSAWRGFLAMFALLLALFALTRVVLLAMTGPANVPFGHWPRLFLRGLWFDVLVAGALLAPFLLLGALLPGRLGQRIGFRGLRLAGLWSLCFLMLFGAVAEITFWLEFSTRFNFIAVDYLLYTHEVIGNIRESYPIFWITAGLALAAILPALWLARQFQGGTSRSWRQRLQLALLAAALPILALQAGNIDRMYGSGNAFADELAGNGMMTFAAAMRRNELDYDRFYATLPQAEADAILQRQGVTRGPLTEPARPTAPLAAQPMGPLTRSPRHVVLISVESLSAEFLDSYGGKRHLTPHLDRLAAEGYWFKQVFATGTRTVRGLEALSLGIPPIPGQAIVRRPGNEHLATLGEMLGDQGFTPMFIYGGYGYFDNMNGYFRGNNYQVIDRTDFPKASIAFENVWGVADESLFGNALTALTSAASQGKRVFAHIMTTSNHRPFTYPANRIDLPSPGGRDGGVKYTDFAIGQFLESARREPWFKDTLFVITADHCASVAGKTQLPVEKYRIPMIWYGPDLLKPGSMDGMLSQVDLAPTLLEVLGARGSEHFFGQSAFAQDPARARAFISNYQALGYLKRDILTILLPKGKVEAYRVDPATFEETRVAVDPELRAQAIAYYQTAAHAFKQGRLATPVDLKPNGTRKP